jgi:hypothetical protein
VANLPDIKDFYRTVQVDHGEVDGNIGSGGRRRGRGWGWNVDDLIRLCVSIVAFVYREAAHCIALEVS